MKRLLIFLGVLFLLLNLGNNGSIAKAKFVPAQDQTTSVSIQYQCDDMPSEACLGIGKMLVIFSSHSTSFSARYHYQQARVEVANPSLIGYCRYFCSSGGVPS